MKPLGTLCMGTHIVPAHTSCIVDATCATATREPLKTSRYLERESFVCLAGRILTYLFLHGDLGN